MRRLTFFFSCVVLMACSKEFGRPSSFPDPVNPPGSAPASAKPRDSAWVTVSIGGKAQVVTGVQFARGSSWFNFSAWNSLERVDGYVFWFYGSSGFNYQYSDSINYSSRPDTLSPWRTTRAAGYGDILFDGLTYPIGDSVVNGSYSGNFGVGKENLVISGTFHGLFP